MADDIANVFLKLRDPDPDVRVWALDEIGTRKPPGSLEILRIFITDPEPAIRVAAACNLGELEDARAIEPLVESARNDESENVRGEAIAALSAFHDPAIMDLLVEEARRPKRSRRPRQEIAKQLGRYDTEAAVDALSELLKDEDVFVREYAAASLFGLNRPRLAEVWRRAALDRSEEVREFAAKALAALE